MPRPSRSDPLVKLTLTGERDEIADTHAYAQRQRRSVSSIFWELIRPLIRADKQANPERYGDNAAASHPTTGEGK